MDYLHRASDHALHVYANEEALAHVEQALSIQEKLNEEEAAKVAPDALAKLLYKRAQLLQMLGRHEAAGTAWRRLVTFATDLTDQSHLLAALVRLAGHLSAQGRFLAAVELLTHQAQPLAVELEDILVQGIILGAISHAYFRLNQLPRAGQFIAEALDTVRQVDAPRQEAILINNRSNQQIISGEYQQGLEGYRKAWQLARSDHDLSGETIYMGNVAFAQWHVGAYEESAAGAEQTLSLAREIGHRHEEARAHINLGRARYFLALEANGAAKVSLLRQAEASLRLAEDLCHEVGQPYFLVNTLNYLAQVYLALADTASLRQGQQLAAESIKIAAEIGLIHGRIYGLGLQGQLFLAQQDMEAALSASTEAVTLLAAQEKMEGAEEEVYYWHVLVCQAAGRPREMTHYLSLAADILARKAAAFSDPALAQQFLQQVAVNRAIGGLWQSMGR